ncbi:MAG TPA: DUF3500 domain-containing protein [Bryobacteraceae bacterium]|nr:DUF3500 domain-containing protein [Bryobacteraceae bacterium]
MKTLALRLLAIGIVIVLLTAAYSRMHSASVMSDAAKAFLNSLDPEQRARATFQFQDEQRFDWHYIPRTRKGLPLKDMNSAQKHLAHALLSAGLSQRGYIKAVTIMSLDEVLRVMENGKGPVRDPENYAFSVFGEPSETGTWGYRVEGHHISQNFTIANGKVQGAPSFFGANPAEVREGPRKGLRVLAHEEDYARTFIQSLTADQKKTAIVNTTAPADILTTNSRKAALQGQPSGLEASKLNAHQKELLQNLLDEYCNNVPEQVAQAREEQIKKAGNNIYFAWAGGDQPGQPHYYRIQSPAFLIEYDDTQNGANHIHSVWRDFNGDFGLDLLKEHYQTSHR